MSEADDADLALVQRIADGDALACRMLLDRHLGKLHAMSSRLLGSAADADEVCQDAFVKAWQQAPKWEAGRARFSTWLYQVTLNLARDRLRGRREQVALEAIEEPSHGDTPELAAHAEDRSRALHQAMALLPERQREAMVMSHFQGMSNVELAAILELSVDALESLLARGRRSLKEHLAAGVLGTVPHATDTNLGRSSHHAR